MAPQRARPGFLSVVESDEEEVLQPSCWGVNDYRNYIPSDLVIDDIDVKDAPFR